MPKRGNLGIYSHGARIGVIVTIDGGDVELARDLAMHVAAANPVCVDEHGVPAETLERERRIFAEQAAESGKPAAIVEKMVSGRIAKFLKEITLLGQSFVKDQDVNVGSLLKKAGATVTGFRAFRGRRRHRKETAELRRGGHGAGQSARLNN